MEAKKRKRGDPILISFPSSSSSSDDDDLEGEEASDFEVDEEYEGSSDDGDQSAHSSKEIEYVDDEDEDEIEDDDEVLESNFNDGGEQCDKVVHLLQRRRNLESLNLEDCKSYLRKHGLRISGVKATCIKRIVEHWRMKDGTGESMYPRSSFSINCTGDVCRGDIILFKQRVYEKFDKIKHGGRIIGKRTIAGRVVKESYGAAKQQHTFTVEVLWSKGCKPLSLLHPLLIKGRNLYRLKTFRQKWRNEAARSKVLAEKHSRGRAARQIREIAKARSLKNGPKHQHDSSGGNAAYDNNKRRSLEPYISNPKQKKTSRPLQHSDDNTKAYNNNKRRRNLEPYVSNPKQKKTSRPLQHSDNNTGGNRNYISYSSNTWSNRSNTGQSSWHNREIFGTSSFAVSHQSNGGTLHHHQPLVMSRLSHVDPRNSCYFYPYCVPQHTSNGPEHQFRRADLRSPVLRPPMPMPFYRPPP